MTSNNKIIFLTDVVETKIRKEKELEFYQKELEKLQNKMFFIRKEIELTNFIINIIEKESVIDVRENVIKLIKDNNDGESS